MAPADGLSGAQARAARALLGWPVEKVAEGAGLPRETVERLEQDGAVGAAEAARIRRALEAGGVEFLSEDGDGVRLRPRDEDGKAIGVEDLNASNDE